MRYDDPELRERLAGEYVLGTMPPLVRRRFERLIGEDATLAAIVAAWTERLAPLDAATGAETPPARVWRAIERNILADTPQPQSPGSWLRSLALWRGVASIAAGACAALLLYIVSAPPAMPPRVVAVLADNNGQPSWIAITGPRRGEVAVTAVQTLAEDTRHTFELWAIAGGTPHPLGLLRTEPDRPLLVSAASLPAAGDIVAISQEPPGGSPTGLPTGPVLYQGKVLPASR